jgi:aminotransferase
VLGNEELVARVTWLQEHVRAGIFVALQRAAIAALTGPQETVTERRAIYEARRERVLAALPTLSPRCEGTFFVWLRLPAGWSSERVLQEARVALAPGEGFGARGHGHARLSLAVADEILDAGLERLSQALREP